ncbi:MAG: hypothetical protein ABIR62_15370 [Dokdonella sp.]
MKGGTVVTGLLVLLLAGCGSAASDAQRREEAINRGDAAAKPVAATPAGTCERAGGLWQPETNRCAMTAALCARSAGEWKHGKGCVMTSLAGGECSGMSGLHMVDGECVMADFSIEEMEQTGMSGET